MSHLEHSGSIFEQSTFQMLQVAFQKQMWSIYQSMSCFLQKTLILWVLSHIKTNKATCPYSSHMQYCPALSLKMLLDQCLLAFQILTLGNPFNRSKQVQVTGKCVVGLASQIKHSYSMTVHCVSFEM